MTAVGTVAVAVAAVWVALWTERRAARRLAGEHERSDRLLKEERALEQQREQFAEAHAVQVVYARSPAGMLDAAAGRLAGPDRDAVIVMINHGRYTITDIDARLVFPGGEVQEFPGWERLSRREDLDPRLLAGVGGRLEPMADTHQLSPWDLGLRIYSNPAPPDRLEGAAPVVRWTDRWWTRWEYRGEVRQVHGDEPWAP
jgi:hypothetical protein